MIRFYILIPFAISVIIFGAFLIFSIESPHQDSQINTMLDAVWWTVATVTTVGYGDVTPVTEAGRIVAIFYMFFGIGIFATIISAFATRYYEKHVAQEKKELENFIVEKLKTLEENQKKLKQKMDELIDSKK